MALQATAVSAGDTGNWRPAWSCPMGGTRIVEWSEYPSYQGAVIRAQEILEAGFARHRENPETENRSTESFQPKEEDYPMNHDEGYGGLASMTAQPTEVPNRDPALDTHGTLDAARREEDERLRAVFRDVDYSEIEKRMATLFSRPEDLMALAGEIHAENVAAGWWDGWLDYKPARHKTAMMLVISELAEAMEGDRKDLMDDHLPHHQMFDVELADAAIRLLDLAGAYDLNLRVNVFEGFCFVSEMVGLTPPEQLYLVIHNALRVENDELQAELMLAGVWGVALLHGINLPPIIQEKREYNRRRADHKRENRAAANGKRY